MHPPSEWKSEWKCFRADAFTPAVHTQKECISPGLQDDHEIMVDKQHDDYNHFSYNHNYHLHLHRIISFTKYSLSTGRSFSKIYSQYNLKMENCVQFGKNGEMNKVMEWYGKCTNKNCSKEIQNLSNTKKKIVDKVKKEFQSDIKKKGLTNALNSMNDEASIDIPDKLKNKHKKNKQDLEKCGNDNQCMRIDEKNYEIIMTEIDDSLKCLSENMTKSAKDNISTIVYKVLYEKIETIRKKMREYHQKDLTKKDKKRSSKRRRSSNKLPKWRHD